MSEEAFKDALRKFKEEWEAGREPVTIPRAQYEALTTAALPIAKYADPFDRGIFDSAKYEDQHPAEGPTIGELRRLRAALRAAGIHETGGNS